MLLRSDIKLFRAIVATFPQQISQDIDTEGFTFLRLFHPTVVTYFGRLWFSQNSFQVHLRRLHMLLKSFVHVVRLTAMRQDSLHRTFQHTLSDIYWKWLATYDASSYNQCHVTLFILSVDKLQTRTVSHLWCQDSKLSTIITLGLLFPFNFPVATTYSCFSVSHNT